MLNVTVRTYRNAYSGLSRETWLLSLIMLINRAGTMVIPFLSIYMTSPAMGYSVGQAGVVFGLFGFGALCGAWPGGWLTDRVGFFPVQLFTLTVGGLLFISLGQMHTYLHICIFTFLLGFVNEAFRPANSTAIAFYSKDANRTRSYALNRLAINLGWALGSGVGGYLADINYELLFWVDGATNIGAAVLLWLFLRPTGKQVRAVATNNEDAPLIRTAYRDHTYLAFAFITMLFACCFFQIFNNLPLYFERDLKFSKSSIGILMATNGIIIALVEMIMIYKLEGKRNNLSYITGGVTLTGLAFLLLIVPGYPLVVAAGMVVIVTFGEIFSMPFMNSYWIARTQAGNRGQYAALYTMAWSFAQTIGPMAGAQVAERWGFRVLWIGTGLLCMFTAAAYYRIKNY